jgi:hypothetical protein
MKGDYSLKGVSNAEIIGDVRAGRIESAEWIPAITARLAAHEDRLMKIARFYCIEGGNAQCGKCPSCIARAAFIGVEP